MSVVSIVQEKSAGNDKQGDFLMLVMEIVDALIRKGFDADEKSIILLLVKKTIGQRCKFRQISVREIMDATGISERHVLRILKNFIEKGAVLKQKHPGERTPFYALSIEFFGRTSSGQIENVYYLNKFKVPSKSFSKCHEGQVKTDSAVKEKAPKSATRANSANPSYISSDLYSYLSREMKSFLETRSTNTKARWSNLVSDILTTHREDESCLMLAIESVQKTGKDFLGNPIRSSMLRLFEETDWAIIKSLVMAKAAKIAEKAQTERMIAQTRMQLQAETASPEEQDVEAAKLAREKIAHMFKGSNLFKSMG